ncbi:MAG: NlpC/P60 family protein [Chloroflexota bacterium]
MPEPPTSPAARLAAMTSPLGGAGGLPRPGVPADAATVRTSSPAAFSRLLAEQLSLGTMGAPPTGGLASPPLGGMPLGAESLAALLPLLAPAHPDPARLAKIAGSPAPNALGTPAASRKAGDAIAWARTMIGRQDWNGLCERFVEAAYGTSGVYPSAAAAGAALITHRGKTAWRDAPPGALLYFGPDATNSHHGHVGIALGGGRMISATAGGVREDRLDTPYWAERFVGWAEPTRFPGRPTAP